jgi:hypothetical protein
VAREKLEAEGYENVVLTPTGERGSFNFTAVKSKEGQICNGSVQVSASGGSQSHMISASCELDETACNPSRPALCFDLARKRRDDDPAKANGFFTKACDGGHAGACNDLAVAYERGHGVAKDEAKALSLYDTACNSGAALACRNLGIAFRQGIGTPKDIERGLKASERSCDLGDEHGCLASGTGYANGIGAKVDADKAIKHFEVACTKGLVEACGYLGTLLVVGGAGAAKDLARGTTLLTDACESKRPEACNNLGILARDGIISLDDPNGDKRWAYFEKACTLEFGDGCVELGVMLERGQGRKADLAKAVELYDKACTLGSGLGCYDLGIMARGGRGIPKDIPRSVAAFDKACSLGYVNACEMRKTVSAR